MFDTLIALLVSFALSAVFCPLLIPYLKKLKFGQQVRDLGPKEHLKKQGTPTMGGIAFLLAITITGLLFIKDYPKIIPILFVSVGCGVVGFLDDYLKIIRHNSDGLSPKKKLFGQLLVSTIFLVYLYVNKQGVTTSLMVPFTGGKYYLDISFLFIPFFYIVMLGTDNGVNLTDGVDGLCTSVTILIALFFGVVSVQKGQGVSPMSGAVVGALMGFLLFNAHPAKIFMGDTGALALGGYVATTAFMTQMPLFIIIVGFIYFAELMSCVIQVAYFRHTGGKRFFRMAPIHHHFELGGWSETQVVTVFSTVTAILCVIAFLAIS